MDANFINTFWIRISWYMFLLFVKTLHAWQFVNDLHALGDNTWNTMTSLKCFRLPGPWWTWFNYCQICTLFNHRFSMLICTHCMHKLSVCATSSVFMQLQHVYTGKYLCVNSSQTSALESTNLRVRRLQHIHAERVTTGRCMYNAI